MSKQTVQTVTEYLDTAYLEYAVYVVENRAIPSVIDGFKPTQRKVVFVADKVWKNGSEKNLKIFQLAGKVASDAHYHHGDCLDPNTEILLSDGSYITIEKWFTEYPDIKFKVLAFDEDSHKFVEAVGHSPRVGQITDLEYEIEMEDGSIFKCTQNHPFLTQRGWIEAKDLTKDDAVLRVSIDSTMKIKSIKVNILDSPKKFYDITVDKHHNFVIGTTAKIITHNSSLSGAIVGMAQKFKNSMPVLDEIGQFGSLRSPEAGAPRYISTRLHPNFRLLYKDFELLTPQYEEGSEIEPKYFLPILPTVLLNGGSGIAVGFATNILNRHPFELIEACIKALDGKKFKEPQPWFNGFGGTCERVDDTNSWIFRGNYSVKNTTTVHIAELPPSMTYEKYDAYLNGLEETRRIAEYDNNCKSDVNYTLKIRREDLKLLETGDKLSKFLKMEEKESENFTVLDETGSLKIFESATDIINYFVSFRLKYYDKRKAYLIGKLESDLILLSNRARFIQEIINDSLKVNNVAKSIIEEQLEKKKFDKISDSYTYLLSMAIHTLTKEKFEELLKQVEDKKAELEVIKSKEPAGMYKEDLLELKKAISKTYIL